MTVYALALGAALLFGLGSVVQQRVASEAPPGKALKLGLLLWLVRRPLWLAGVGTALVGNLLSGTALGLGSVALVQPLLVSRLLFALPLSAAWARRRLTGRDWAGALATAGGLGAFIAAGHPGPGNEGAAPLHRWLFAAGAIAIATVALVLTSRGRGPARKAPMLGAGAGMLFGLQSGFTHTAVRHFIDGGLVSLLTNWTTYAVVVTAVLGTLLAQSAYEMAPLAASYPALAAVEPLTGIGIGVGVLGGSLALGVLPLGIEIVGLAIMTAGIYLLATSPLVTGRLDLLEERQEEEIAARTEDQIEHEMNRLIRDMQRLETGRPRPGRTGRTAEDVCKQVDRIDVQLGQLDDLRVDIGRHRDRARERAQERPSREQAEAARAERRLEGWQRDIDDRDRQLRARAGELRRRAESLGGS